MFTYADVSGDAQAPARARIDDATVAQATALGFEHLGYIEARAQGSGSGLLSRMLVSSDGATFLSLLRVPTYESWCFKTLLRDGTVISTELRPRGSRLKTSIAELGVRTPAADRYDVGIVAADTLAALLDAHRARVARAVGDRGAAPFVRPSIDTALAMRKRWREIADPRAALTFLTCKVLGAALPLATLAVAAWLARESPRAMLAAIVGALGVALGAAVLGFFGGLVVGPLLGRFARVPPPRSADALLGLAADVRKELVQPPSAQEVRERAATAPIVVAASPDDLARMKARDLALATANAALLPLAMLAAIAAAGPSAWLLACALVCGVDGAILLVSGRSRAAILRSALVPTIGRATERAVCSGIACVFSGRFGGAVWLAIAVLAAVRAPAVLAASRGQAAPAWLFAELAAVLGFVVWTAVKSTRREQARFAPASA